jgi:uncharacterized protein YcbK (DUF882 family)
MPENWSRRRWIQTVLAGGAGLSLARAASAQDVTEAEAAAAKLPERSIELFNTHTAESRRVVYRRGAEYDVAALAQLNHVLRDHRSGDIHEIDVRLFDQLHDLALAAHCEPRYEIISGYRSAESNAKMSARPGSGVAKKSLHMQGRALDVRLKGCSCADLRDLALAAKQGGVGYYQRSDFVHLDTGTFRTWVG